MLSIDRRGPHTRRLIISLIVAAFLCALPQPAQAVHRAFDPVARNWTGAAFYGARGTFFADLTGDGKADAIVVDEERIRYRVSDGCRFGAAATLTDTPFFGAYGTFFADVTGDGKADAIAVHADRVTVRRSEDGVIAPWITGFFVGGIGNFFADVTGDGKADAIIVEPAGITVRRSNGVNAFGPREDWSHGSFYGSRGTYFANVTSGTPARADAIAVNAGGIVVRRSQAITLSGHEGFGSEETWTPDAYYGTRENAFVDVTGDGRADAIVVNADGIAVRDAIGDRFRSPDPVTHAVSSGDAVIRKWGYWTMDPFYGTRGTFFADVDGDLAADAIAVNDDGIFIRRARYTDYFKTCPPSLILRPRPDFRLPPGLDRPFK